jgi:hypothetical protein
MQVPARDHTHLADFEALRAETQHCRRLSATQHSCLVVCRQYDDVLQLFIQVMFWCDCSAAQGLTAAMLFT